VTAEALAQAGGLAATLGLGVLLVVPGRWQRLAGLAAFGAGMALFLPLLAPPLERATWAGAAVAGLAVSTSLAVLFRRWPWAVAALALLAVPARIPVTVGDTSAKLLLPLYAVIAGAAVALAWSLWHDEPHPPRELGPLSWPAALLAVWFAVSALWVDDVGAAAVTLFFFILPFTLLALVIARLPWRDRAAGRLYGLLMAMALLFAGIGIWQWVAEDVFWNEKVIASNAFRSFHRVNSVFWDPSMYGRFLVVAILGSLVLVLLGRRRWDVAIGVTTLALWVGLLFSFSQSSFLALLVGLTLAAALVWRRRAVVAAVALCAAVAVSVGVASPGRLDRATSGRFDLVVTGIEIAAEHPLLGVGVGGFQQAYDERAGPADSSSLDASHTTPVTVVAETGLVGLALFAWLVAAAFAGVFRPGTASGRVADSARLVAGVCLAAVFTHSLFYNAFFEDPLTWELLALGVLATRASAASEPPAGKAVGP
jgi:putative inorganic carbon (hco3(-)) transporter